MTHFRRHTVSVAIFTALLLPSVAIACLWDHDTIWMERSRFPNTLELITGKFLRHSPEFYQWRIEDRLQRLKSDPEYVLLLDDLAVAYDKTGQHDKAIETALRTEELHPGRYETAANLGTFYIHAGRFEEGLPHIQRALDINPDAHFGREKYQKLLVEYVLDRRLDGPAKLPLADVTVKPTSGQDRMFDRIVTVSQTFTDFLDYREGELTDESVSEAITGILGMMKFSKHDSPVLLEALGTLLVWNEADAEQDAKLLATRAFLKASYEAPDESARAAYREMAAGTAMGIPRPLAAIEPGFQAELREGQEWYAELRKREESWIRDGKNPEAEFDKLYDAEPTVVYDADNPPPAAETSSIYYSGALIPILFVLAVVIAGGFLIGSKRNRSSQRM